MFLISIQLAFSEKLSVPRWSLGTSASPTRPSWSYCPCGKPWNWSWSAGNRLLTLGWQGQVAGSHMISTCEGNGAGTIGLFHHRLLQEFQKSLYTNSRSWGFNHLGLPQKLDINSHDWDPPPNMQLLFHQQAMLVAPGSSQVAFFQAAAPFLGWSQETGHPKAPQSLPPGITP